jgi:hypothetical protein
LERVFDETVATDDGGSSTADTLHETLHVVSLFLRALTASGSRADAEKKVVRTNASRFRVSFRTWYPLDRPSQ